MNEITVIIVDDQRLVREGIASLLSLQEGIRVIGTAEDGRKGVQLTEELQPDILLMDIRMPVQDGIVSVEKLKKRGFAGQAIMLTTFDDEEYIVKSLRAGAVGYLMKDIPVEDLARAIRQTYNGVFQMTSTVMGSIIGSLDPEHTIKESRIPASQLEMIDSLSEREKEVFREIGKGLTNAEIAEVLFLSKGTVKNYVSGIFTALGLRDRVQAALLAVRWMGEE